MATTPPYNETDLLHKIAAGDETAFKQLFLAYHPAIYTIIERLTGMPALSEDLTQDCFLKVWLHRSTLPALDNFGGWLRTVASNRTMDALRKSKADAQRESTYHESAKSSFTPTENLLLEKEYTAIVQQAVASLPERQRQVFVLVRQQGRSREEAAQIMNISAETVKSNLQAATAKVRAYCIGRTGEVGLLILAWALR